MIVLAALLVAAPAAGAKRPAKSHGPGAKACKVSGKHGTRAKAAKACARKDAANAARRCRAERRELGDAAFRARYGGKRRAFGRCVSSRARSGKGERLPVDDGAGDLADDTGLEDEAGIEDETAPEDDLADDDRSADDPAEDDTGLDEFEEELER